MARKKKAKYDSILKEAYDLITKDRADKYGNVRDTYQKAAEFFFLMTGIRLSAEDIIKIYICGKMAREAGLHMRDNLTDQCGYTDLLNQMLEGDV